MEYVVSFFLDLWVLNLCRRVYQSVMSDVEDGVEKSQQSLVARTRPRVVIPKFVRLLSVLICFHVCFGRKSRVSKPALNPKDLGLADGESGEEGFTIISGSKGGSCARVVPASDDEEVGIVSVSVPETSKRSQRYFLRI